MIHCLLKLFALISCIGQLLDCPVVPFSELVNMSNVEFLVLLPIYMQDEETPVPTPVTPSVGLSRQILSHGVAEFAPNLI